jgi:hypothetical protein
VHGPVEVEVTSERVDAEETGVVGGGTGVDESRVLASVAVCGQDLHDGRAHWVRVQDGQAVVGL